MRETNFGINLANIMCRRGSLSILVLALTVVGCAPAASPLADSGGQSQRLVQPGPPGEATRQVGTDAIAPPLPHTPADARFMQRMIVHHGQALVMSRLVDERTTNPDIRLLAQRIEISQVDEIELMKIWLEKRGEEVPALRPDHTPDPTATHHHDGMAGMLTDEELARLAAATGSEFDRLFLSAMIRHHEGALVMVSDLFAAPGAVQEEEIFIFASHVEGDQRIEIARMNRLLLATQ